METEIINIINEKIMAEFIYSEKIRIGAICKFGHTKERDLGITFFQTEGESTGSLPEWRDMRLNKISNLKLKNDLDWKIEIPKGNGKNNFIADIDIIAEISY